MSWWDAPICLRRKNSDEIPFSRAKEVNLSRILDNPYAGQKLAGYNEKQVYDFKLDETIDESVFLKKFKSALSNGQKKSIQVDVSNVNRALGNHFRSGDHKEVPGGAAGGYLYHKLQRKRRPELWRIYPQGPDTGAGG